MSLSNEWSVQLTKRAERDLRRIRRDSLAQVRTTLNQLKSDPQAGEPLAGELMGVRSLHFSLPGSGQYRAAYFCKEDSRVCIVFMIGSRENFYREAERRWNALRSQE